MLNAVALALVVLGLLTLVVSGLVLIVRAFQTSPLWGLAYLFIPFASLVFVIVHWDVAKNPFLKGLLGVGFLLGGALLGAPGAPGEPGSWVESGSSAEERAGEEPPEPGRGPPGSAGTPSRGPTELPGRGKTIYSYRDDAGNVHMVDSLEAVPARYRDRVRTAR